MEENKHIPIKRIIANPHNIIKMLIDLLKLDSQKTFKTDEKIAEINFQ